MRCCHAGAYEVDGSLDTANIMIWRWCEQMIWSVECRQQAATLRKKWGLRCCHCAPPSCGLRCQQRHPARSEFAHSSVNRCSHESTSIAPAERARGFKERRTWSTRRARLQAHRRLERATDRVGGRKGAPKRNGEHSEADRALENEQRRRKQSAGDHYGVAWTRACREESHDSSNGNGIGSRS